MPGSESKMLIIFMALHAFKERLEILEISFFIALIGNLLFSIILAYSFALGAAFFARDEVDEEAEAFLRVEV